VELLALTTGQKVGLAAGAGAFIVFALLVSMVIPRARPDFPGRALPLFLVVTALFFAGTLGAVVVFGAEEEEIERDAEVESEPTEGEESGSAPEEPAQTSAGNALRTINVRGEDFRFILSSSDLGQGRYRFRLRNAGQIPHNLVINGPEINNEATPVIDAGETATLDVGFTAGTYKLYCNVPGHEEAGMRVDVEIGA